MLMRVFGFVLCAAVIGACQPSTGGAGSPASPSAASALSGAGVSGSDSTFGVASLSPSVAGPRPWKANLEWRVAGIQFANPGQPFDGTKSLFDGRCSVMSDYVIGGAFEGEATHAGHVSGATEHCSQITFGPEGPTSAAYTDGRGWVIAANGSSLTMRYGQGVSGVDPATGENFFHDTWTFTGGTGLFAGATGNGEEEGRFKDFPHVARRRIRRNVDGRHDHVRPEPQVACRAEGAASGDNAWLWPAALLRKLSPGAHRRAAGDSHTHVGRPAGDGARRLGLGPHPRVRADCPGDARGRLRRSAARPAPRRPPHRQLRVRPDVGDITGLEERRGLQG